MKKVIFLIISVFYILSGVSYAQDLSRVKGTWLGSLDLGGIELRLVFNISDSAGRLVSLLDSPDQGATGIPTDSTIFRDNIFTLYAAALAAQYAGEIQTGDTLINGKWKQAGREWDLVMHKQKGVFALNRPQEPKPPFPYTEEEVYFRNEKGGVDLAGTLTIPQGNGPFPAVILITGSGPQNRNEELMGHKPFLVIADHLTRNGIAVLRYDDRGIEKSKGTFGTATSFDFADDAEAGLQYLATRKEINKTKIGFAGHSEGGMIAPIIAARNRQTGFIILLAGPGDPGRKILIDQTRLILEKSGESKNLIGEKITANNKLYDILEQEPDSAKARQALIDCITHEVENSSSVKPEEKDQVLEQMKMMVSRINTPWFRTFIIFDPMEYLVKVKCPLLAINGTNDLQVPCKSNLAMIEKAMKKSGNSHYKIIPFEGLNHLFQHSETGLPSEYGKIDETFSTDALELMASWIKGLTE